MLRKRGRPFKGPTPEGVFQTVDVGSAGAEWLRQRAQKFSRRKYAAVDPYYAKPEIEFLPKNLGASGVLVRAVKISDFIDEMKAKGWRTRHFNIDMPEPFLRINDKYDFPRLFSEAEHVMLPGGKIFISSENQSFLTRLEIMAARHGFKARALKPLGNPRQMRTESMVSRDHAGGLVYRIELQRRKPWVKSGK